MSLFEDLIEELKEQNLIEETVIETTRAEEIAAEKSHQTATQNNIAKGDSASPQSSASENSAHNSKTDLTGEAVENPALSDISVGNLHQNEKNESAQAVKKTLDETDFYRRRATEEVTSLKIVEHIISGVEREMMKIAPKSYDAMPVSIALHDFLQITSDAQSAEHSLSEFRLLQETENWYSALSNRDKFVTVGDLRRYCETTRPVLSVQALIALARFYRNAPFSAAVRSKFDMVLTRLVTKELKNDKRQMVFERGKLVEQISGLYQDWSSIPLYAGDEDSKVLNAVSKFEDFINEVESAVSFEDLIKNDFFNRLRIFKDGTGENFYSPLLLATAIECNVAVGNRYIELIAAERESSSSTIIEEKYQSLLDQTASDAASKTLQLVDILHAVKEKDEEEEIIETEQEKKITLQVPNKTETAVATTEKSKFVSLKINKWLVLAAILVFILTGGLYVWVEKFGESPATSAGVEKVNLEDSALKEYFKAARINDNTYYVITQPSWKDLAKETKEDVLKKTLAEGANKGYTKIIVLNEEGKTIGFASPQKGIELSDF